MSPKAEVTGLYADVAVFTRPFRFRGFIKRDIYLVTTYGLLVRGGLPEEGAPLRESTIRAIELEEGSEVYWPVSRTRRVELPEDYPDDCKNWGAWHVYVVDGSPLPDDLHQNPKIKFTG